MSDGIGRTTRAIPESYIPAQSTGPEPQMTAMGPCACSTRRNRDANVETDYASVVSSDVPIVAQHTRLDSTQAENALPTTVAYAADDA